MREEEGGGRELGEERRDGERGRERERRGGNRVRERLPNELVTLIKDLKYRRSL